MEMPQRDMVQAASEFAARNQLPRQIEEQMLNHICLRFRTEGLKQQETLEILPKAMRASISLCLFFPVVQGSYLFKGVSTGFIQQLVRESCQKKLLKKKTTNTQRRRAHHEVGGTVTCR